MSDKILAVWIALGMWGAYDLSGRLYDFIEKRRAK